jgi:peptidoglycan/xylan/chitin deacetylase (PgdA/CDA1 family)
MVNKKNKAKLQLVKGSMMFHAKPSKRPVSLAALMVLAIIILFFTGCRLPAGIRGESGNDSRLPLFSDSYIEFIGTDNGYAYPGQDLTVHANIVNSGSAEARDIMVRLIADDLFIWEGAETSWSIDRLEAGKKTGFSTRLALRDDITEDSRAACRLEISSEKTAAFTVDGYGIEVYGVKPFEGNFIPIIGLHAIEDHIEEPIELYTSHFDDLCRILKEYGYETITFADLLDHVDFGKALPERPVIITSDDGFQSMYTNAFPILKKYGYEMTVFLVTGAVGETEDSRKMNTYFNKRTRAVRPILIWPEIEKMHEYGCEFLSHSVNHIRLGLASDEEFLYELSQSKQDIETRLGSEVLFFAWPYDNNSPSKWQLIPEAGYRGAVRYGTGIEDMRTINLFDIKRVEFNSYIPPYQYAGYLKLDRSIEIEYTVDDEYGESKYTRQEGDGFTLEYIIKNTGKDSAKITSMELMIPENIRLSGVSAEGYVDQFPGISEGVYMWVSDSYAVAGNSEIDLILELEAIDPGESIIDFRITYRDNYIESDSIEIEIKSNN